LSRSWIYILSASIRPKISGYCLRNRYRRQQLPKEVAEDIVDKIKVGVLEYEIAAEMCYMMQKKGATGPAFDSIVSFGKNSAEPHYTAGKAKLKRGDFVCWISARSTNDTGLTLPEPTTRLEFNQSSSSLACTRKRDFIYHGILPGGNEHMMLMGVPYGPKIFRAVSDVTEMRNVILTRGGCGYLHAVLQIKKSTDGDGKNAIMAAFTAHTSLKHVVVVDEDIDLFDPYDIEYAIATRVRGDKDIMVITGTRGIFKPLAMFGRTL
jgi:hypothetical protein